MVQQSQDVTSDNLLEIYLKENGAAKNPADRNQALARYKKGLQNIEATDSGAQRILKFLDQIPG